MWAAAQANGVHVFIHTQTGGVKVNDTTATTLKVVMEQAAQVNQPMTEKSASKRMITQCVYGPMVPQQVMCELIGGGVRRALPRPALRADRVQRALAGVAGREHGQVLGHRHRPGRRLVARASGTTTRPDDDQPGMAQLFRLNEKWPYPLMPSEYVQRQFHVSFQDDPVAVACRHVTGLSTIVWGNDYPHAEGTFRGQPGAASRRSSAISPPTSGPRWSAAPSAGCSGSAPVGAARRRSRTTVAMPRMKMSANGFATSRADTRPPAFSHRYV